MEFGQRLESMLANFGEVAGRAALLLWSLFLLLVP